MGYHQHRDSPLTQIDKRTVKRLVPVWNVSLGVRRRGRAVSDQGADSRRFRQEEFSRIVREIFS